MRAPVVASVLLALAACGPTAPAVRPTEPAPVAGGSASTEPDAVSGFGVGATPGVTASTSGCPVFPPNNVWHSEVSRLPVRRDSETYIGSVGATAAVHPDFGAGLYDGGAIGIPVTIVPAGTPGVRVAFDYADESDAGPYPIPASVKIEAGSDRHIVLYDRERCRAYELFAARRAGGGWRAGSGAIFDLRANALRPAGWTSADAAGLSILAGLVRYEEVASGHIDHAIRITVPRTRDAYVWPARHAASTSTDAALPPMGLRLRLKSTVDISRLPPQARVIARAMQRFGVMVADNGSPWFISGAPDDRWSNDALRALKTLRGSDFEVVDTSGLRVAPDSAAARAG